MLQLYPTGAKFPGYLSIYLQLLDSENSNLEWPFNHKIHITLKHVERSKNHSQTLNPNGTDPLQRPKGGSKLDRGFPMFFKLKDLMDQGFILHDCLTITAVVEKR